MKTYKRTSNQTKIIEGMDKVYDELIEFKKKMNSELVILKEDKIVRIKPWFFWYWVSWLMEKKINRNFNDNGNFNP